MASKQQEHYNQLRTMAESLVATNNEFSKQIDYIQTDSAKRIKSLKSDMKDNGKQIEQINKQLKKNGQAIVENTSIKKAKKN